MKLSVIHNGSKFEVFNERKKKIYTIKHKGFGTGRYLLIDKNGYQLYVLTPDLSGKRPKFKITWNDKPFMDLVCTSMFVDPTIEITGKDLFYSITSNDRKNFTVFTGENSKNEIGYIKILEMTNGDNSLEIEINDKYYDDYMPFLALSVEITYAKEK